MEATKSTKKVVPESGFITGWSQIPPCFRELARQELMAAFGIDAYSQFYSRMRGEVEPRKSQIEAIESVFAKYGVTEIWGIEPYSTSNQ